MFKGIRRDDSGQDLAEYAIVFIVLCLLLLGIIEFGIIMFSQNTVSNVAREGARWAVVRRTSPAPSSYLPAVGSSVTETCPGSNDVIAEACDKALGLAADRLQVNVSRPSVDVISVQAQYTYAPFFGLISPFLPAGLPLGSQSTMRLE